MLEILFEYIPFQDPRLLFVVLLLGLYAMFMVIVWLAWAILKYRRFFLAAKGKTPSNIRIK